MKEMIKVILLTPASIYVFIILWLFGDIDTKEFMNELEETE